MEWIERHSVFIMLGLAALGWFAQFITSRHQLGGLLKWKDLELPKWQETVIKRLEAIDHEINQVKISDAREIIRVNTVVDDVAHMRRVLDDFREMFITALSSGNVTFNRGERKDRP